ncbi:hypothetical protein ACSQ67_004976 [Phaseolus vulgaris]
MEPAITEEILPAEEDFTTEETLPATARGRSRGYHGGRSHRSGGAKCSREEMVERIKRHNYRLDDGE